MILLNIEYNFLLVVVCNKICQASSHELDASQCVSEMSTGSDYCLRIQVHSAESISCIVQQLPSRCKLNLQLREQICNDALSHSGQH